MLCGARYEVVGGATAGSSFGATTPLAATLASAQAASTIALVNASIAVGSPIEDQRPRRQLVMREPVHDAVSQ